MTFGIWHLTFNFFDILHLPIDICHLAFDLRHLTFNFFFTFDICQLTFDDCHLAFDIRHLTFLTFDIVHFTDGFWGYLGNQKRQSVSRNKDLQDQIQVLLVTGAYCHRCWLSKVLLIRENWCRQSSLGQCCKLFRPLHKETNALRLP